MIERLRKLQATKSIYASIDMLMKELATNLALKKEVKELSLFFLKRSVGGCNNCVCDAYIELINLKNITDMKTLEYRLRAGALLRDVVNSDASLTMSNFNLTEEGALYHLRTNPDCIKLFDKLPEDIEKRLYPAPVAAANVVVETEEEEKPSPIVKKNKNKNKQRN